MVAGPSQDGSATEGRRRRRITRVRRRRRRRTAASRHTASSLSLLFSFPSLSLDARRRAALPVAGAHEAPPLPLRPPRRRPRRRGVRLHRALLKAPHAPPPPPRRGPPWQQRCHAGAGPCRGVRRPRPPLQCVRSPVKEGLVMTASDRHRGRGSRSPCLLRLRLGFLGGLGGEIKAVLMARWLVLIWSTAARTPRSTWR
ncbi:uncharacterized protein [Oryza sativa Japonica Group]|uniref:Os05g0333000 protein n=2 Tax=Oryza sativa subsp. japonica TaxID=39947 RepID=B7F104_ORYSJ|nr:uncharacterized protein LOC9269781 [Oryza sativa Japonica Group]AAV43838.1 unknown protein [Oryza sativa Japonica Group]BAG98301.1 unnamed protein product [Oryza sativa Japonica Group]BAH93088.1 Os05g0333000 [Oryza sativa Japonica Group]|eukprot:NP_001174360.1 Os05g0333000 [Oryza sativa Japonica Group]